MYYKNCELSTAKEKIFYLLGFFFSHKIIHPKVTADEQEARDTFQNVYSVADDVDGVYRKACESCQNKCEQYVYHPDVKAVKGEGQPGLSARTQGKIRAVYKGAYRFGSKYRYRQRYGGQR